MFIRLATVYEHNFKLFSKFTGSCTSRNMAEALQDNTPGPARHTTWLELYRIVHGVHTPKR